MWDDYADDPDLPNYLERAIEDLHKLYIAHYATNTSTQHSFTEPSSSTSSSQDRSPSKENFTSQYRSEHADCDEPAKYFKHLCKDWEGCNPLHWYLEQCGLFPCLFSLAWDLLTIPGKVHSLYFYLCRV